MIYLVCVFFFIVRLVSWISSLIRFNKHFVHNNRAKWLLHDIQIIFVFFIFLMWYSKKKEFGPNITWSWNWIHTKTVTNNIHLHNHGKNSGKFINDIAPKSMYDHNCESRKNSNWFFFRIYVSRYSEFARALSIRHIQWCLIDLIPFAKWHVTHWHAEYNSCVRMLHH